MKAFLFSFIALVVPTGAMGADDFGDRSKTVTAALEATLKKQAADITAADLAAVTELKLPHIHIPEFKADDFAGMTKLKTLHFYSLFHKIKKGDASAPASPIAIGDKVFAKLSSLEELHIKDDQLGGLPDDVFVGLTGLKVLSLSNVTLTRLPKSMLTLPKIETVYYDGKGMEKDEYEALKKALGDKLKAKR